MFPNTTDPIHRFLMVQPWFAELPLARQREIEQQVFTVSARKGAVILQANEPVLGWYAVLSGLVTIERRSGTGRNATYLGVSAGEWFGEGSTLKNEPRRYDVIALRDTELLCLPNVVFHALHASSMGFNQFLVAHLNQRLGQAMAIIDAGRTRSPEQRIALSLSRLFWSRTRQLDLSQDELASLAGMSRQTANRALNTLQQQGLISLSMNRISVLDDTGLSRLLLTPPT